MPLDMKGERSLLNIHVDLSEDHTRGAARGDERPLLPPSASLDFSDVGYSYSISSLAKSGEELKMVIVIGYLSPSL